LITITFGPQIPACGVVKSRRDPTGLLKYPKSCRLATSTT
jgi:hypothetical protein